MEAGGLSPKGLGCAANPLCYEQTSHRADVNEVNAISYVIVTYNSRQTIAQCIESVLGQNLRPCLCR